MSSWLTVSCFRISIARRILRIIAGSSTGMLLSRVGLGGGAHDRELSARLDPLRCHSMDLIDDRVNVRIGAEVINTPEFPTSKFDAATGLIP